MNMSIRKKQSEFLKSLLNTVGPQLIIVEGRLRIGKTHLINECFKNDFCFKITGNSNDNKDFHLQSFTLELFKRGYHANKPIKTWLDAFYHLECYLETLDKTKKQIVFFDEIPWLDNKKSFFKEAFEFFWNNYGANNDNLIFIACASSSFWLEKNIIQNTKGLFNRHTAKLYLEPFNLKETEEFLISKNIHWSRHDITQAYMILGGIPFYLDLLDDTKTLNENINELFFKKNSTLVNEYHDLFSSLFHKYKNHKEIIEIIFNHKNATREMISSYSKIPENGVLTKILNDLIYSGFVKKQTMNGNKKDIVYQISDYFTSFYLKFIKDKNGLDEHYWTNSYNDQSRIIWYGYRFEDLCFNHLNQIKDALGISGVLSEEYSYLYKAKDDNEMGAQIDMVIERKDKVIDICEIKYYSSLFTIDKDYHMDIRNKISVYMEKTKCKRTIQLVFISSFGVKRNEYSNFINKFITIDDLFRF